MSVTVYSSPACAYCHMAKEYLKSKKVAFKEYQWVMDNVGQAVTPVLDVNGTVVLGFDRPKIDAALATK